MLFQTEKNHQSGFISVDLLPKDTPIRSSKLKSYFTNKSKPKKVAYTKPEVQKK
jgi:hypothetical protein